MDKVFELFGSRRFWLLTIGALSAIGGQWAAGTLTPEFVFNTITAWAAAIVSVGSFDKWADKLSGR